MIVRGAHAWHARPGTPDVRNRKKIEVALRGRGWGLRVSVSVEEEEGTPAAEEEELAEIDDVLELVEGMG